MLAVIRIAASVLLLLMAFSALANGPAEKAQRKMGAASRAASSGENAQIRCWQYGKLIFEENGWIASSDVSNHAITFKHRDGRASLQLIDLKSGNSVCLLRREP